MAHADIAPSERVLEIGTGTGALTTLLARVGASFVGYEVDRPNYLKSLDVVAGTRGRVVLGDAFEESPDFDVLVASLPYSESSTFVEWLAGRSFNRAVVVLQEDFVRKITAPPGTRDYRGISALAQIAFGVRVLERVSRTSFSPVPRVNSVVVRFTPKHRLTASMVAIVTRLFSIRRRQVNSAMAELGMKRWTDYGKRRVYSLNPDEVFQICQG